ncbi:hypothetical protein [Wolbachia endosymbiont of Litomosoides sigmodontis]|uniref:hypothetical protein n=1 Tax=Wolbachia endosymbiont of Litomosoides sigmodontis TaxID=80850 RepID=UPI0026736257|nr:hypothetical protein [Wolbachia endosymbiont of Litomosoides sigmodontis]
MESSKRNAEESIKQCISKNMLHFKGSIITWIKYLKFGREENCSLFFNIIEKSDLDQNQFE